MFEGFGTLNLDRDHLDLSFRDREAWPGMTPAGSIKSFMFEFGDAEAGPMVQLGLVTHVEGETLDWAHSVDPVHHHGTDQFRLLAGGAWTLAGRPMTAGSFAFQESGYIYQEHPGKDHTAWMILVLGDRRGKYTTLKLERDLKTLIDVGEDFGAPIPDGQEYPHPAGSRGIAAIATTSGPCDRGYRFGRFADLRAGETVTGLLGDEDAGPVVHLLKAGPNETALPACVYATELFFAVAAGSCRIGEKEYQGGDLRIQRAGVPLKPVVAGPSGLEALLVVADRRAVADAGAQPPEWMAAAQSLRRGLSPLPGGPQRQTSA